jgi:hypothetical protein
MTYTCSVCGQTHDGLGAWAFKRPDHWLTLSEADRARGQANDDLCKTPDGHFFVRCILLLPLVDGPEDTFEFGVWSTLSEQNFGRYVDTFDDKDQSKLGPMFGYLANEIRQFPGSAYLHANIHPQDGGDRPIMELEPTDHSLARAQAKGIRYQDALSIIHGEEREIMPAGLNA